jgi:hypothetical protein
MDDDSVLQLARHCAKTANSERALKHSKASRENKGLFDISICGVKMKDWTCLSNLSIGCDLGSAKRVCTCKYVTQSRTQRIAPFSTNGALYPSDRWKKSSRSTGRRVEIIFDLVFPTSVMEIICDPTFQTTIIMTKSSIFFWRIRPDHVDRWVLCTHSYFHSDSKNLQSTILW